MRLKEPAAYRADRDIERFGDIFVRPAFQLAQHDHHAVILAERGDAVAHPIDPFRLDQPIARRGTAIGRLGTGVGADFVDRKHGGWRR